MTIAEELEQYESWWRADLKSLHNWYYIVMVLLFASFFLVHTWVGLACFLVAGVCIVNMLALTSHLHALSRKISNQKQVVKIIQAKETA